MKNLKNYCLVLLTIVATTSLQSCSDDDSSDVKIHDVSTALKVSVDRFSAAAGTLMVRNASNGLPAANASINFDAAPFITKGLGPSGQIVEYYNFDVQSSSPAPIYVFFRSGESTPLAGQLNVINTIPGDAGYNDFWQVVKVTVPDNYKANQFASEAEILSSGYSTEVTTMIVNCPVVPEGSTASKRIGGGSVGLVQGWYKEKLVSYFTFEEKAITATGGAVPTSPIFVCFNINPNMEGGGPASGFKTETDSDQTHNVLATIPSMASYSPLWLVNAFDNAEFMQVSDLTTAEAATSAGNGLALVNCPVVSIQ